MTDGPTTINGPLHTSEADLNDREMVASFSTPEGAESARRELIDAGIAAARITVIDHAADSAGATTTTRPVDDTFIGMIREAVMPDDSTTATRSAIRHDDAVLTVRPLREEVDTAVRIIQGSGPSHFDADLERWRNAG